VNTFLLTGGSCFHDGKAMSRKCLALALCLISLLVNRVPAAALPTNLTNGLVALFPFDGNALDASGTGNNATPSGITYTNGQSGAPNSAAHFGGLISDYLVVPDSPSLHDTNLTVAGWFRTTVTNQSMQIAVKAHYGDSSGEQWSLYTDVSDYTKPMLVFAIKRNSSGQTGVGWNYLPAGPITTTNQWIFFAATWDGKVQNLFINGTNAAQSLNVSPGGIDDVAPGSDIQIGRSTLPAYPYPYTGDVDQLAIYNRALSTNEVAQLYAIGAPPPPVATGLTHGLVEFLPFDGNTLDESGSGNNGTPSGITYTNGQSGLPDSAVHFGGAISNYVMVPDAPSLHDTNLTVAGWFRTTVNNESMQIAIKAHYGDSAGEQWSLYIDTFNYAKPTLVFAIKRNSGGKTGVGWNYLPFGPFTMTNQWIFFAGTWDGSVQNLYVNGTNAAQNVHVSPGGIDDVAPGSDLQIGRSTLPASPYPFTGDVDQFTVFNRALSAGEVAGLYQAGSPLTTTLASGLVASFPFAGNTLDASGNGNNGTPSGITYTDDQSGLPDSAAHFGGLTNDYVEAADAPSLHDPLMTVAGWFRTPVNNESMQIAIKAHYGDSAGEQWSLYIDTFNYAKPTLVYAIKRNSAGKTGVGWNYLAFGPFTMTNQWIFFAGTWDGSVQNLYVNGTNAAQNVHVSPGGIDDVAMGSDLQIGRSTLPAFPYPYTGDIDQLNLYNRALTAEEVASLYQLGAPAQPLAAAEAVARVDHGFVVEIDVTDPGFGYTNAPLVMITGGGGSNATAVATISTNGVVSSITITNPGSGYTNTPTVTIAPPAISPVIPPSLEVRVKSVEVTLHVTAQRSYVIETSVDFKNWTQVGASFIAQSDTIVQDFDVGPANTFFRLRDVTPAP